MKTLDRYLSILFMKTLFLAHLGITGLYWFQNLFFRLMDSDYPAIQILTHELLGLPQVAIQMLPPSVMIGVVFTLAALNKSHELTAIYSLGVSLRRVVALLFTLIFLVCCLDLVVQDRVLPKLFKKRTA
jgi:lipopolysaccharide export LptBFGC system permease protein LptF